MNPRHRCLLDTARDGALKIVLLAGLYLASAAMAPGPTLEYEVKAAFLLNFITFTEWPPAAFEAPTSPLRICLPGDDPFAGILARTVQGESVGGHPLVIEHPGRASENRHCHVLFIPGSPGDAGDLERAAVQGPVLIVGDSDGLWRKGATISFAIDGGRVRFDVNQTAAALNGLRLSPRLLKVARRVR